MGAKSAAQVSAFRAFPTRLRAALRLPQSNVSIDVLLTWATQHFTGVPVKHAPRLAGRSNYTIRQVDHARLQSDDRLPARCR